MRMNPLYQTKVKQVSKLLDRDSVSHGVKDIAERDVHVQAAIASYMAYLPAAAIPNDFTILETRYQLKPDVEMCIFRNKQGNVFVCFAGSSSLTDWKYNFKAVQNHSMGVGIHSGFLTSLDDIVSIFSKHILPSDSVYFCGHSLGGALAVLAAYLYTYQADEGTKKVNGVFTFGSPKVGNKKFAKDYDAKLGQNTHRYTHTRDLVARVPFDWMGYKHAGCHEHELQPYNHGLLGSHYPWVYVESVLIHRDGLHAMA